MAWIGVVAIAPMTKREPVPEFPKSRGRAGLRQFPTPVPVTTQFPGASCVSAAPKARRQLAVEWTSPDSSSPEMRVFPRASAPKIRARWDMDLSPGTRARPESGALAKAVSGTGLAFCIVEFERALQAGLRVANAPLQPPLVAGTINLVKADLGTKRACPSCNARFYDLAKRPIECPKCGFSYEPESLFKQRRGRTPDAAPDIVPADEVEDEEEEDEEEESDTELEEEEPAVQEAPLNVAATGEDEDEVPEEEEAEAEAGMSVVEGDEEVAIEDIEVEDDEDDDDDLLGEVEDEEDDVSGIIDPTITKDEG